jgi:hypothetical protein
LLANFEIVRSTFNIGSLKTAILIVFLLSGGCGTRKQSAPDTQARSPDGRFVLTIHELTRADYTFQVVLSETAPGQAPTSTRLYSSPDEGPRGTERILWSKDGRHALIVGKQFGVRPEAVLPSSLRSTQPGVSSAEAAYLLYNTDTRQVWCNSSQQTNFPHFSTNEVARIFPDLFPKG